MIKFLECSEPDPKPIEYILVEDTFQEASSPVQEVPVDNSAYVPRRIQPVNEVGKQLLRASFDGNLQEVKYLLTQGGTQFISDWVGTSPLHLAAQNNHVDLCELFVKKGMFKDARNKVDRTPLHLAASEGHYQVAEVLIKYRVDINTIDMLHMTPLHWAVQNGHTALVELLLRNGAHVNVRNKFDLSPQDIAYQINKLEIVELLQAYEGDGQGFCQDLVNPVIQNADGINDVMEIEEDSDPETEIVPHPIIVLDENEVESNNGLNVSSITSNPSDPMVINLENSINQEGLTTDEPNQGERATESPQEVVTPSFTTFDSTLNNPQCEDSQSSFSAIKLLQEHGISMLPNDNDESNLLNTVVASGHSVVLTEVGKEMLKSLNEQAKTDTIVPQPKRKKTITLSPQQFLALTEGRATLSGANVKVVTVKPDAPRIAVKKDKATPFANNIKVQTIEKPTNEVEDLLEELAAAKKTIEEYKSKLNKKELEVEKYKFQLKLLLDSS